MCGGSSLDATVCFTLNMLAFLSFLRPVIRYLISCFTQLLHMGDTTLLNGCSSLVRVFGTDGITAPSTASILSPLGESLPPSVLPPLPPEYSVVSDSQLGLGPVAGQGTDPTQPGIKQPVLLHKRPASFSGLFPRGGKGKPWAAGDQQLQQQDTYTGIQE